jgi:hypothetical protein
MRNTHRLIVIAVVGFAIFTLAALLRGGTGAQTAPPSAGSDPSETTVKSPPPSVSVSAALPPNNQTDAAPAAAPADGALTGPALGQILQNMGCDMKDLGGNQFAVTQTRGTWTLIVTIGLSPDSSILWFYARFTNIPDLDSVPSSVWRNLLLCNQSYGITFCLQQPQGGQAYVQLQHGLTNQGITPQIIKKNLDLIYDSTINTANWWDTSKWPTNSPTTQPAK